jgi:hypothetical protein
MRQRETAAAALNRGLVGCVTMLDGGVVDDRLDADERRGVIELERLATAFNDVQAAFSPFLVRHLHTSTQ